MSWRRRRRPLLLHLLVGLDREGHEGGVPRQHSDSLLEHLELVVQRPALLHDVGRLPEELRQLILLVESVQELELELVLNRPHKVEADGFGNGVTHVPNCDRKVRVKALADFGHEGAAVPLLLFLCLGAAQHAADTGIGGLRPLLDILDRLLRHARVLLLLLGGRLRLLSPLVHGLHGPVLRQIHGVVSEEIPSVARNLLLDYDARRILLLLDDVLRHAQRRLRHLRKAAEDGMGHALCNDVEGGRHIMHALHRRDRKLLKVRQRQELEGVGRGKTRERVPLVHPDGAVDVLVRHVRCDAGLTEVQEEVVHDAAHPRSAAACVGAALDVAHVPLQLPIVLPADGVLEHFAIIGHHCPHDLHALSLLDRQAAAKLIKAILDTSPFLVDLLLDLWQEAANMSEEDLRQLVD
mmetsp:Transcript_3932/g.8485  ORF Transcript_3932/g.8485 Transcript_3932/m.8485 type:complete len:409 (-) Transcript_3932:935-2161(-)